MRRVLYICVSALFASLLTSPFSQAAVSSGVGVATNGLVMYFDPANQSAYNGSNLRDLSGNGYDATFYKTGLWPGEETSRGKYLGFDGAGGYLDLANNLSSVSWTSGITISFYANFGGGAGNFERIIDFGNAAESDNIIVGRHGTSTSIFAEIFNGNAGGQCVSSSGVIGNGTWDFWTVTFDGANCKIYKNNSLLNSIANTRKPTSGVVRNNAYIGKSNWADAAFEGGITDLAVYNRVLGSTEMTQNYYASLDDATPTIGTNWFDINENISNAGTATASETVTFEELSGYDGNKLNISSSGAVTFVDPPNYEDKLDSDANNIYGINIRMVDSSGNYSDSVVQVRIFNVNESSSVSAPILSATPYKGVAVTITVTPAGDGTSIPGKITYLMAGKRIVGCYKKSYSGTGNATCTWEPTTMGFREITVTFTPTNTSYYAATSKQTFLIYKRTTRR